MKEKMILAAMLFTTTTFAQQTKSKTDSTELDEVVVTANKFEQKQSNTGKLVQVINQTQIRNNISKSVGQLLNEQAGIIVNGSLNNAGTNQSIFVRGGSSGRTLILVDGNPVNDPSLINNEFDINLLSLANIESIEICKGAQSTLYGSDAIAGVINIITKKDNNKKLEAQTHLSYGSFNTIKTNQQFYGKLNKLSYNVKISGTSSNGFSSALDSTNIKNYDKDKYFGNQLSTQVSYELNNNNILNAFVQSNNYKTSIDEGAFKDEKDFTLKNKNLIAGLNYLHSNEKVKFKASYQYSETKRIFINDSLDKPGFAKYVSDNYFSKNQFVDAVVQINIAKGLTLTQGADFRYSNMNSQYLSLSSFGPYTSDFNDTSQSQISLYNSIQYNNNNFNIEIGGRLSVHSRYGFNSTYSFNPSFKIDKNTKLFLNIATGFKAPTLYQLYSAFAGNSNLKPETSKNIDFGISYKTEKIKTQFVYFFRKIKNGIDYNNIGFSYFNNIKQNVNGLELDLQYKPINKFTIGCNYTLLNASELTQSRVTFNDTTYKQLLRRPKHSLNLNLDYAINKITASVTGKYVSNRYDYGGYQKSDINLNSYFIVGANIKYEINKKAIAYLDIQNLANKKFFDLYGFNSIPLTANLGVILKW